MPHDNFVEFPKIARLYKGAIAISEKIDGTNAQIYIEDAGEGLLDSDCGVTPNFALAKATGPLTDASIKHVFVYAGSRTRMLSDKQDNFGFWHWAMLHANELAALGPGRHFGEWWGKGIQRGYGKTERTFSLFNVGRWYDPTMSNADVADANAIPRIDGLSVVPLLYRGPWFGAAADPVSEALRRLSYSGSTLDHNTEAEGVVVYHEASGVYFKAPYDEQHKGQQ
jgi:hypothetical protein